MPESESIKEEKLVRIEYETYWDIYCKGDIEAVSSTLDENIEMIDNPKDEVAHNKTEGIEFFKGQAEELIGKTEMRNR
jgi:hypothetical protein